MLDLNFEFATSKVPKYQDHCHHGEQCFVARFANIEKINGKYAEKWYDVYAFEDKVLGAEVCIRYGNEEHEYISPGRITDLARHSHVNPLYDKALRLIMACRILRYERREQV